MLRRAAFAFALLCGAAPALGGVLVLTVRDAIGPATADYVERGLAQAAERGAALVVLELDTPGGLDASTRGIVQAILASPVPVACWVGPPGSRAASAGTYILYACHVAAMAPSTTLGAATPVAIGAPSPSPTAPPRDAPDGAGRQRSDEPPVDAMTRKRINDSAAFIRGLAQLHGRNADWAERAVREAVSLTAQEALRENVIDLVAVDRAALLAAIDGRTVRVAGAERRLAVRDLAVDVQPPDRRHRILSAIANPGLATLLLMLGVYGLLLELLSPGFGVPGTVGAICLLLALVALQMLPFNVGGLALLLLGVALLVAEALTPAFGILALGGVVAIAAGALLLFDRDVPGLAVPWPVVAGVAASGVAFALLSAALVVRQRRARGTRRPDGPVGERARVDVVEGDEAWAVVQGVRWRVRAATPLATGQWVRVTGRQGLTLTVAADAAPDNEPRT